MARDARDPYAILGVPADASRDAIAAAYRRLARRHHPDVGGSPNGETADRETADRAMADRAMADVNWAWGILSDAARRRAWDARSRPGPARMHWAPHATSAAASQAPPAGGPTGWEAWQGGGSATVDRSGGIGCMPLAVAALVLSALVLFGGLTSGGPSVEPETTAAPVMESVAPH